MLSKYDSYCGVCRGRVKVGESIEKHMGRWCHLKCAVAETERDMIVSGAVEAHKKHLGINPVQYSVSYSRGEAMNFALGKGAITKNQYDTVRKSPTYRALWNYVPD